MTFTYPAVITPHKDDDGFHIVFPDLELCEGDGPDLEDALDDARGSLQLADAGTGRRRRVPGTEP